MKYKIYIIEQREVFVPDKYMYGDSDKKTETITVLGDCWTLPVYNNMEEALEAVKNLQFGENTYTILPIFKHEK